MHDAMGLRAFAFAFVLGACAGVGAGGEDDDACRAAADALGECFERDPGADCGEAADDATVACGPAAGKADEGSYTDSIAKWLAERARRCYEARNAVCLEATYWALAAGARARGLHAAASMMEHFLWGSGRPAQLPASAVQADPAVKEQTEQLDTYLRDLARAEIEWGTRDRVVEVPAYGPVPIRATGNDLYYASGTFSLGCAFQVDVRGESAGAVEARLGWTYQLTDRYDWHDGSAAGGTQAGVAGFEDRWAVWLVEQRAAAEFDMSSTWSVMATLRVPVAAAGACTGPCGAVTYAGECAGNEVRWCEDGQLRCLACTGGSTCGFTADIANCVGN